MRRLSLLVIIVSSLVFNLSPGNALASASERETELFNKGYEYLFSYKPDKAAETFRTFLKEFPDSSARDAAMFWLGKTLISMKLYNEAELTFQTIQMEFPDSPFIVFIEIEMKEIARVRSVENTGDVGKTADMQKDTSPKLSKDNKKTAEPDKKITSPAAGNEQTEALLTEERRTNQERQLRIADLDSREALLGKQKEEFETQMTRLSALEKSLKEATDEKDRLNLQLAQLKTEKSRQGKESVQGDQETGQGKVSDSGTGEAMRLRLSQLEVLAEDQGKELSRTREEQERLSKQIAEEKKFSAELKADLTRSKEREQEFKTLLARTDERKKPAEEKTDGRTPSAKEIEKLTTELSHYRSQVSDLQNEKKQLSDRISDMELQAAQRLNDMKILNSYLSQLMFRKKETSQQKPDTSAAEERDRLKKALDEEINTTAGLRKQLAGLEQRTGSERIIKDESPVPQPAASTALRIRNREYSLSQIIDYQSRALLTMKLLGIENPVWRVNNPIDDFLAEELLVEAAKKINVKIDEKKQKEMVERYKLRPAEASYLERAMIIGRYIDSQFADLPSQQWIELLSVEYKPGDAASKTVLATDLQKTAREGTSFKEIARKYPDGVKFSRLTPQEFSTRFKDKSQILQKLNFLNEETVVMWSERGYMLIKPVSGRAPFNPLEDLAPEKKKRLQTFLLQRIAELQKQAAY